MTSPSFDGRSRTFSAPAKLNLALRVVGRRPDGYHLLQSLMVFFPLYDRLRITPQAAGVTLCCEPPVTQRPEENLVYRAALALLQESGLERGARLQLRKGIPDGAGLGGGSSDAALTLMALNRIWGCGLSPERLMALGLALGADLPFFLGGRSALVQGVGERLTPLPDASPVGEVVVVFPGVGLSTGRVFSALAGMLPAHAGPLAPPARGAELTALLENDLEAPALVLAPVIGDALRALERVGAKGVRMTGSGSSVFGVFGDAAAALRAAAALTAEQPDWRVFSGGLLHTHPFEGEWSAVATV